MNQIFRAKQDDNPADHAATMTQSRVLAQIRALQRNLDELTQLLGPSRTTSSPGKPSREARQFIRTILSLRADRHNIFGPDLFGEPSWDMLLELYDAEHSGRRVSVSSLCIASGSPATTALRWIKVLEREGLIKRVADPTDGRRYFLELTDTGRAGLDRFFTELQFPVPSS